MPPHSTSLPRGERPRTRCVGAIGLLLATGSTVMSRSKVRVEIEPIPFAVSMSSLVNLMQFVVIAFLLVCVAMMVTLQLAKARTHRRQSAAERGRHRSFCSARNGPQGQGKKIGDNLCGRGDSCDQHYRATQHIRRKPVTAQLISNG